MCPIVPNALWACDFQFDTTADGRTLKMLNIVDEYTREALTITVDRSIDADKLVAELDRLAEQRGGPAHAENSIHSGQWRCAGNIGSGRLAGHQPSRPARQDHRPCCCG
jgi:hypothetical protein